MERSARRPIGDGGAAASIVFLLAGNTLIVFGETFFVIWVVLVAIDEFRAK